MPIRGFQKLPNPFNPSYGPAIPLPQPPEESTDMQAITDAMRPGKTEIGTKVSLETPVRDVALPGPEAAAPAAAASGLGAKYGSAGIMAGAELAGGLGAGIIKAAQAEQEAKQAALASQAESTQAAMRQAGRGTYGALANLIKSYRSALK